VSSDSLNSFQIKSRIAWFADPKHALVLDDASRQGVAGKRLIVPARPFAPEKSEARKGLVSADLIGSRKLKFHSKLLSKHGGKWLIYPVMKVRAKIAVTVGRYFARWSGKF
jgi:hypothetical protein